jgi:Flp pilus assembly protein TadG
LESRPRSARRLASDRGGGALIEFGLLAPVVVAFICCFVDICLMMFINAAIEGGLRDASRYAITGATFGGLTREQRIAKIVSDNSYGLVSPGDLTITYKVYPSFGDIGKPEPYTDSNSNGQWDSGESFTDINGNGVWDSDMGTAGTGGSGDVVNYIVTYKYRMLTPFARHIWGGDDITFSATAAVRNEPY